MNCQAIHCCCSCSFGSMYSDHFILSNQFAAIEAQACIPPRYLPVCWLVLVLVWAGWCWFFVRGKHCWLAGLGWLKPTSEQMVEVTPVSCDDSFLLVPLFFMLCGLLHLNLMVLLRFSAHCVLSCSCTSLQT